jgi:hypothetical protein
MCRSAGEVAGTRTPSLLMTSVRVRVRLVPVTVRSLPEQLKTGPHEAGKLEPVGSITNHGVTSLGAISPIAYRSRFEYGGAVPLNHSDSVRVVKVPLPLSVQALPSIGEPPLSR